MIRRYCCKDVYVKSIAVFRRVIDGCGATDNLVHPQERSMSKPVKDVVDFINGQQDRENMFSSDEIEAAIQKMTDDNQIMVSDNILFLI